MTAVDPLSLVNPDLTRADHLLLRNLLDDVRGAAEAKSRLSETSADSGYSSLRSSPDVQTLEASTKAGAEDRDASEIARLRASNDPSHSDFDPTVVVTWDLKRDDNSALSRYVLRPYVRLARRVVRNETDVVMLTHLLIYFTTSVPSALGLYHHFSYLHGVLHAIMQVWYTGSYTLMMHQHIHMGGVLNRKYAWFDKSFPYILDPLHGHTWNSYYFHHVKHHHVEGNGPSDLSSTIRYQRDSIWHFLHYVGRFYFFVWLDLPLYFLRKKQYSNSIKTASFELGSLLFIYVMATYVSFKPTLFVYIIPLMITRLGLMIGNWGQHAFVDEVEPDSDFRSSITLIDVASNRYCFNDGYHTSHHLNPRRHWRDHPIAFLGQKHTYAKEGALVFHNIDYLMITFKLMRRDYKHLARCLIPIGSQIGMSIDEIAALLETKTRRFTDEEINKKFKQTAIAQSKSTGDNTSVY